MSKPEFVYVTYIETTPEKLWEALTSSEFTKRYWWDTSIVSDWKVGSSIQAGDERDLPPMTARSWKSIRHGGCRIRSVISSMSGRNRSGRRASSCWNRPASWSS